MSASDSYSVLTVTGTGATLSIPVTWAFDEVNDLRVWCKKTADGTLKKSEDSEVTFSVTESGGSYTVEVDNPWGSGEEATAYLWRETDREQNFTASGGADLNPTALVEQLDKLARVVQELDDEPTAGVKSIDPFEVPPKEARASKVLGFDANGDPALSEAAGTGDMTKAVYDTDGDGRVDVAEAINDGTHSATAADVADAVSKRHTSGSETMAGDVSGTVGANTVDTVGGASAANVASAASLKHTQGTDQYLDQGGASEVSAAQAKSAYDHSALTSGNPHNVTAADAGAAPSVHATQHASGGADPVTPSAIGAAAEIHAATHATGGADQLTPADIGAADLVHTHDAADVATGTLDGNRLPAISSTKKGGVPATGTPSGLFLKDDGTWDAPAGGGTSDHGSLTGLGDDDHSQYALLAGRAGDRMVLADDATTPPLSMTQRSTPPSSPADGDLYLDDGSNTASGNPGWRRYDGVALAWEDVSAGAGGASGSGGTVQATDGNTYNIRATNEGATAGNARGENSVDLQTDRSVATQVASSWNSAIGGGAGNTASGPYSTVGGGNGNAASLNYAVIGGGISNVASAASATVGGGDTNQASGPSSTVSGGTSNTASGGYSTVGGGGSNVAGGSYSAVAGGYANSNYATYGFAAGYNHALSGEASAAVGYQNSSGSNGKRSFLHGQNARGERYGEHAHGANRISTNGDIQCSRFVLGRQTPDGNSYEVFLDGSAGTQRLVLRSGEAMHVKWHAVARNGGGDSAGWDTREFTIKYDGTTIAFVGTAPTGVGADQADSGLSSATITPATDATNHALKFSVASSTPATVNWTIVVEAAVTLQ